MKVDVNVNVDLDVVVNAVVVAVVSVEVPGVYPHNCRKRGMFDALETMAVLRSSRAQ